jgi:hypothetical protein
VHKLLLTLQNSGTFNTNSVEIQYLLHVAQSSRLVTAVFCQGTYPLELEACNCHILSYQKRLIFFSDSLGSQGRNWVSHNMSLTPSCPSSLIMGIVLFNNSYEVTKHLKQIIYHICFTFEWPFIYSKSGN